MTALERDVPSVPLTMGERDIFARLTAAASRCRFCRKAATGVCGCCCPEHDTPPPPVTTRYDTRPGARLRALASRVARSAFAADVRRAYRAAFWPAVIGAGVLLAVVVINVLAAGGFVTWTGFEPIPTGGTR